jgi:hypothetical protein
MACYISSNDNRFYAALEATYGAVAAVTAAQRFGGVRLSARQKVESPRRRDKTGTRTWQGLPASLRKQTSFELQTYLTSRDTAGQAPGYGPLIQSALGADPRVYGGGSLTSANGTTLQFSGAHGLSEGMAVTFGGEIRFVAAVPDGSSVVLSAPFTVTPGSGSLVGPTVSYAPAKQLRSVSVYDYWSPDTALQRLVRGAAVDELEITLNGDFHQFRFSGVAVDLIDNSSFESGQGGLTQFPPEPLVEALNDEPVPGHLGQAWLGTGPSQLNTLASASVLVKNNLETRQRDFGSLEPRCLVPGERKVTLDFELYSRDQSTYHELYQAARQRSPIALTLQMGEAEGQLCGVSMKGLIPEVPELIDDEPRLRWRFGASRALGTVDDELYVAFG